MKDITPSTHGLRGYASVFGNLDDYGTIVDRGAFRDVVSAFNAGGLQVPLAYGHSIVWSYDALPIGIVTRLLEDDHGLYFEAELADTEAARDVLDLVSMGAIPGASFSFDTLGWEEDEDGVEHFTKLDLWELGPCCWGANPEAYTEVYDLSDSDSPDTEGDDLTAALTEAAEEIAA